MKAGGLASLAVAAMVVVVLTMALFTVEPVRAAVTCDEVRSSLGACFMYVTGREDSPSGECCNRVRNLNAESQTPEDRREACKCVKELATKVSGVRPDRAAQLPQQCGVNNFDPNQDCDRIH